MKKVNRLPPGTEIVGQPVNITLPDGRTATGVEDANGVVWYGNSVERIPQTGEAARQDVQEHPENYGTARELEPGETAVGRETIGYLKDGSTVRGVTTREGDFLWGNIIDRGGRERK